MDVQQFLKELQEAEQDTNIAVYCMNVILKDYDAIFSVDITAPSKANIENAKLRMKERLAISKQVFDQFNS